LIYHAIEENDVSSASRNVSVSLASFKEQMKWLSVLALLALAAVATHADMGVVVDGVEYVDTSSDMPRAHVDEVISFVEKHTSGLPHDGSREVSQSEIYTHEEAEQALSFIAVHNQFRERFIGNAMKGLKEVGKNVLNAAGDSLREKALEEIVRLGKAGFNSLSPRIQQLIRDMVGIVPGGPVAAPAKAKAAAKKAPNGMDPFAFKHYKKGFVPGNLGRPNLMDYKVPKAQEEASLIEDCMACRFVWKNVEMDVGNLQYQKTVYDSFMHHCRRGMGAPLLYQPCQAMFSSIDDMVHGYVSGLSVDEVCAQARMCR